MDEKPQPQPKATLLVVDDEEAVRRFIAQVLKLAGFQVLEARDGVDGLEVAESHEGPIDLVITDVVMPRLDGRSMAKQLLNHRPDLHFLFISGYTDDIILQYGLFQDGLEFVPKPFSPATLLHKVRYLLQAMESRFQAPEESLAPAAHN